MAGLYPNLNPEKALIWRILHRDNLPWVLENGLHCGNSPLKAPNWVSIGKAELIDKRASHPVKLAPGGLLNDYVPFYFTPFSVMMHNINTGYGVQRRAKDEIVILVSSMHRLKELALPFLFTDSHAYYGWANYYSDLARLDAIDWGILQRRDFRRDPENPAKFERYQAEALVHQKVPLEALLGIMCHTEAVKSDIEQKIVARGLALRVYARPDWYF